MPGDGQPTDSAARCGGESRERDLFAHRGGRAGVARNGEYREDRDGGRWRSARVRSGGQFADDENESEHDAPQRVFAESLSRFTNRPMADRLLRQARDHHVDRRKPKRFRRENGFTKYSDEERKSRAGWSGGGLLRRGTESRSCPQHAFVRAAWLAGYGISCSLRRKGV